MYTSCNTAERGRELTVVPTLTSKKMQPFTICTLILSSPLYLLCSSLSPLSCCLLHQVSFSCVFCFSLSHNTRTQSSTQPRRHIRTRLYLSNHVETFKTQKNNHDKNTQKLTHVYVDKRNNACTLKSTRTASMVDYLSTNEKTHKDTQRTCILPRHSRSVTNAHVQIFTFMAIASSTLRTPVQVSRRCRTKTHAH